MRFLRIDESSEGGKVFADFLREELVASGKAGKNKYRLASGECRAYIAVESDFNESTRRNVPLVFDIRDELIHGDEPTATLADVEAYLRDREGSLAIVYHLDCAVLATHPVGAAFHSGDNGDFGVWECAAFVRAQAEKSNEKRTESRRGGDGGEHEVNR